MPAKRTPRPAARRPLRAGVVLQAAVTLADTAGIETVSMRNLAQELGVVPMALYTHVANKEDLLGGMVDVIIAEIAPPTPGVGWQQAVRGRILSARRVMLRHPWASTVIASRTRPTPTVLGYIDSLAGLLRAGGFSAELTHQAMHALGSRMWGFNLEVFPSAPPPEDPALRAALLEQLRAAYPHIAEIAGASVHRSPPVDGAADAARDGGGSIVGAGCDDQFEFEFGLDILLDGLDRLHRGGWAPHHS